jgi:hypothetical protein
MQFELNTTTYEFPYTGPPGMKHENPIQRGPKAGGILCYVYLAKGPYRGQLAMPGREGSTLGPVTLDKKEFKQMLMAPYSARRDMHLWAALDYPPDVSPEFLKEYVALMTAFEKQVPQGQKHKNERVVLP